MRVILARHGGEQLDDPPGRDLFVRSGHSFAQLARAIDAAQRKERGDDSQRLLIEGHS